MQRHTRERRSVILFAKPFASTADSNEYPEEDANRAIFRDVGRSSVTMVFMIVAVSCNVPMVLLRPKHVSAHLHAEIAPLVTVRHLLSIRTLFCDMLKTWPDHRSADRKQLRNSVGGHAVFQIILDGSGIAPLLSHGRQIGRKPWIAQVGCPIPPSRFGLSQHTNQRAHLQSHFRGIERL